MVHRERKIPSVTHFHNNTTEKRKSPYCLTMATLTNESIVWMMEPSQPNKHTIHPTHVRTGTVSLVILLLVRQDYFIGFDNNPSKEWG